MKRHCAKYGTRANVHHNYITKNHNTITPLRSPQPNPFVTPSALANCLHCPQNPSLRHPHLNRPYFIPHANITPTTRYSIPTIIYDTPSHMRTAIFNCKTPHVLFTFRRTRYLKIKLGFFLFISNNNSNNSNNVRDHRFKQYFAVRYITPLCNPTLPLIYKK